MFGVTNKYELQQFISSETHKMVSDCRFSCKVGLVSIIDTERMN